MRFSISFAAAASLLAFCIPGMADDATPGVTKNEIRIGNTVPYSGPASSKGATGRVIEAYSDQINEKGGVKGRKLKLFSLDLLRPTVSGSEPLRRYARLPCPPGGSRHPRQIVT